MDGIGYYHSPIGWLEVTSRNERLISMSFVDERAENVETPLIARTLAELDEYFHRGRKTFSAPLEPEGTEFQRKVWAELLTIPCGKTLTYTDVAQRLGDLKAIRAVGTAIGQNPLPIIIPCHRVIGRDGDLTGYMGGLERKKWLLQHEGAMGEQTAIF
jgi:methylated-DNA-[protein]-cysteine S-methyltransferase